MVIVRGNSCYWTLTIQTAQGSAFDLQNCTVFVTYKASNALPDSSALFQHSMEVAADGTVTASDGMKLGPGGAAAGIIVERLSPLESINFAAGTYLYDVEVVIPNPDDATDPDVYTPINGDSDTVVLDITRSVDSTP